MLIMTQTGVFDLIEKCHPSTIHYLLRRPNSNFDIRVKNAFKQTPLLTAASTRERRKAQRIIEYLIEFGGNYTSVDAFGRDLLFYSAIFGLDTLAEDLMVSGEYNLLRKDNEGRTILHHAVCKNRENLVRRICSLIEKDAQLEHLLTSVDNSGSNPIDCAFAFGHLNCFRFLLSVKKKITRVLPNIGTNTSSRNLTRQSWNVYERSGREQKGFLPVIGINEDVQPSVYTLLNLQAYNSLPTFRHPSEQPHVKQRTRERGAELDAYETTVRRLKEEATSERNKARISSSGDKSSGHHDSRRGSRSVRSQQNKRSSRGSAVSHK